ncbi:hypothetical protein SORBI_3001G089200 [Sorghum bicolor]|uniref:Uncharacterized protein n=1 Tax=Sorghum bicolor TaxID=4558 RepID=A0A1B6QI07_SORBI|nr:hypothetical protein SORBI_3001G089200 [Sorghum bicolor]
MDATLPPPSRISVTSSARAQDRAAQRSPLPLAIATERKEQDGEDVKCTGNQGEGAHRLPAGGAVTRRRAAGGVGAAPAPASSSTACAPGSWQWQLAPPGQ